MIKPIFFVYLVLFFSCKTLFSQEKVNWQKRLNSYHIDRTTEAVLTDDGGYLIGGHVTGPLKNAIASADTDVWVVKLNEEGTVDWEKLVEARNKTVLRRVFETTEEAKLVINKEASGLEGDEAVFSIGNDLTSSQIQGSVKRASNYEYRSTSLDMSNPSFLNEEVTPEEIIVEDELWMLKVDPAFEIAWKKKAGQGTERVLKSIVSSSTGNILATGYSNSLDEKDPYPNKRINNDFYVASYSQEGKFLWSKYIGGAGDDKIVKAIATKDGGYLLGGNSNSRQGESKTAAHLGGKDWWVVKIDDQGEILWQRSYGNFTDDSLVSIQELENGDIILGGTKSRIAQQKYTTIENEGVTEDFSIIKINEVGLKKWQLELGGSGKEYLASALQKNREEILISGITFSSKDLKKEETASDLWIINYDIQDLESFERLLKQKERKKKTILKSPFRKPFNRLEFYDQTGALLDTKFTYKIKRFVLKKEHVPEGTYYVRVVSGKTAAILDWSTRVYN